MILSMTGFGSGARECGGKRYCVDVKSLNSKQLDMSARVPSGFRSLELELRNMASGALERGKVELTLTIENLGEDTTVKVNAPVLAAYKRQIEEAAQMMGVAAPQDWFPVLMRFPDAVQSDGSREIGDDDRRAVIEATQEALVALVEYRTVEGRKLEEFFVERINRIDALLARIPEYEGERIVKIRSRIEEGLQSIPKVEYDKGRLEQEMIFYIEKLDINEEKQRLRQHLDYFIETLKGQPGQGKKLGFISQEMGREINTMGSKSNHAEMQILVVKMKDELEQIKEQVLNAL